MVIVEKIFRYSYQYCEYLKVVHKDLTLNKFLACAGIKNGFNGFGDIIFSKLYYSVMAEAENMEDLYERYYKPEYCCFKDFISAKFSIPQKPLELLMNGLNSNDDYTLIRYDSLDYGVTGVNDFIYSNDYDDLFEKLFLLDL